MIDAVVAYCAGKPGAFEDHPFGETPTVYKVGGKMFAIVARDECPPTISLKCDPDFALELRTVYDTVVPGYHLNKRHWNTVSVDGAVPGDELLELIDHSYELVVAGLPRSVRDGITEG